ncbi:hypothetical protein CANCADRAFT_127796 [Tortispora caseinolytica NRRL Y-17796]|uniref:histidine kinase n=1 Tax=Tortispora caseinolytica NRRL Y-17796 TaxID=767744 RepID=A0A1E4TA96_9ASCO|nr:hypothetical protein CANCADRAFT_127796 [Tortispora caseinolytica NRRL Y-17796]
MKPPRVGIRIQLISWVSICVVLSLVVNTCVLYFKSAHSVENIQGDRLIKTTESRGNQIYSSLNHVIDDAEWLSSLNEMKQALLPISKNVSAAVEASDYVTNLQSVNNILNLLLQTSTYLKQAIVFDGNLNVYTNRSSAYNAFGTTQGLGSALIPITNTTDLPPSLYDSAGLLIGPVRVLGSSQVNGSQFLFSYTLRIVNGTGITGISTEINDKSTVMGYLTLIFSSAIFQSANPIAGDADISTNEPDSFYIATNDANSQHSANADSVILNVYSLDYLINPSQNSKPICYSGECYDPISYVNLTNLGVSEKDRKSGDFVVLPRTVMGLVPLSSLSAANWTAILLTSKDSFYAPVSDLRNSVIIICLTMSFGVCIATFFLARISLRPIIQLRDTTVRIIAEITDEDTPGPKSKPSKKSSKLAIWMNGFKSKIFLKDRHSSSTLEKASQHSSSGSSAQFNDVAFAEDALVYVNSNHVSKRLPSRVPRRQCVLFRDEFTDLTEAFNKMIDELFSQYSTLEFRVSERTRELEKAKLEAENANEAKTAFIANISHELRTPLNGILGITDILMTETSLTKIRSSLMMVSRSGELLLHLLTDLLTFSKNQLGHVTLDESAFLIFDITDQILMTFSREARKKGIVFAYKPDKSAKYSNYEFLGDTNRLLQVLINIVSNSLKFTERGGAVVLTLSYFSEDEESKIPAAQLLNSDEVSRLDSTLGSREIKSQSIESSVLELPEQDEDLKTSLGSKVKKGSKVWLVFDLKDTGIGIADNIQDRVFEAFVQGDSSLSKKYSGTGLGLAICRQLCELMGGSIKLAISKLDVGTTIRVKIPLKFLDVRRTVIRELDIDSPADTNKFESDTEYFGEESVGSSPVSPIRDRQGRSQKKILIADDNSINQEIMRRMLDLEGYTNLVTVYDGKDAIETMEKEGQSIDLVFMDVQMPHINGLEATRHIRTVCGYKGPIIALTAYTDQQNRTETTDVGMDYFLAKPIRKKELHDVLKKFL